jgi:elongation factor G
MQEHTPETIRNVAFASHSGSGKTTLQEACLFLSHASDRLGRVEDGNTVSDYLPDEIRRKSSIYCSPLAFESDAVKFNFLDTPGFADFFGEVCAALSACENVTLVANATAGLEVGLEEVARKSKEMNLATFVFINHLDRERASFDAVFDLLRKELKLPVVALTYPLGTNGALRGTIDVIAQKAYEEKNGKSSEVAIPDEVAARVSDLRQALVETTVECDDALMERYLDEGELSSDEIHGLLKKAVAARCAVPVLCGSAARQVGVASLLSWLEELAVSPAAAPPRKAIDADGNEIEIAATSDAPFSGYVFKTFSDPFTGRLTYFKICAGTVRKDAEIFNLDRGHPEKIAHLFTPLGKKHLEVPALHAGDIALVIKLRDTGTGDSLAASPAGPRFPRPALPESLYSLAIEPVTHGDDDKLSSALGRICSEDPTLKAHREKDTGQMVISGLGDIHLATAVARLKSSFSVDVKVDEPRVPYRETIRNKIQYEGKYKKQSGGHGQFADVWVELEPAAPDSGFEFVDRIVGGAVPRSFIPAVEEGITEAMKEGPLAGYPVVDLKVTLYDGKYHDVDSSYQTFKIAGGMALRGGARAAGPVLLEPITEITIQVPEDCAGDVVGDLNSRRGHVLGMEPASDGTVSIKAHVPDAELTKYPLTLRSLAHGRGSFTKRFDHYSQMPEHLVRPISEAYQKRKEAMHSGH